MDGLLQTSGRRLPTETRKADPENHQNLQRSSLTASWPACTGRPIVSLCGQMPPRRTVRAEQEVPVDEVGGEVDTVDSVVDLVVGGSADPGHQSVQSPGQLVATVVLHRQPGVEEVEDGFAQRVAAHRPGAAQGQQQQGQQLHRAAVLSSQGEGRVVPVVQLVGVAVEPGDPEQRHMASVTENQNTPRMELVSILWVIWYTNIDL